ncbi:hypothetical protein V1514DRAFT_368334 [Lipomyces japonicus]|uniref:uncharacterized protein n=1 Tax=Lipomyces japonicus TaxID=56871 RepID=UPI0034CF487A
MNSHIQAIDASSVHKLTSGQVVVDLPTAVKELVENSLDAHASSIEVRFKQYGLESFEVIDNGDGIDEENFEGIALKHHTSKLRSFSDVESVITFGFRGEALNSLCAVSASLQVTTCASSTSGAATKLEFDSAGKIISQTSLAGKKGTSVLVSKLFEGKLPVRRIDLAKNCKREFAKCVTLLQAYGIIKTGVKIVVSNTLASNKKSILFTTNGNASIGDNIINLYGRKSFLDLTPLSILLSIERKSIRDLTLTSSSQHEIKISGFVSQPTFGLGRTSPDRQFVYVNGRPCTMTCITKAINEVYKLFNIVQYPVLVANLQVDLRAVDINVSPDKRMILLHDEALIVDCLKQKLEEFFNSCGHSLPVQTVPSSMALVTPASTITQSRPSQTMFSYITTSLSSSSSSSSSPPPRPLIASSQTASIARPAKREYRVTTFESPPPPSSSSSLSKKPRIEIYSSSPSSSLKLSSFASDKLSFAKNASHDDDEDDADADVDDASEASNNQDDTEQELDFESGQHTGSSSDDDDIDETVADDDSNNTTTHSEAKTYETRSKLNQHVREQKYSTTALISTCPVSVDLIKQLRLKKYGDDYDQAGNNELHRAALNSDLSQGEEQLNALNISRSDFNEMKIIGQFNLGFIIALRRDKSSTPMTMPDREDLFIIDQHASDEKYNFERLQKNTQITRQPLVIPQALDLTPLEELLVISNKEVFEFNGFGLTIDDDAAAGRKCMLTTLPMSKSVTFDKRDFMELLHMVHDSPGSTTTMRPSKVRQLLAMRACRSSVMIGTALSMEKMKSIVESLSTLDKPWNCPHGRPTMRHLGELGQWSSWQADAYVNMKTD